MGAFSPISSIISEETKAGLILTPQLLREFRAMLESGNLADCYLTRILEGTKGLAKPAAPVISQTQKTLEQQAEIAAQALKGGKAAEATLVTAQPKSANPNAAPTGRRIIGA